MRLVALTSFLMYLLFPLVTFGEAAGNTAPQLLLGFKALADRIPTIAGSPAENERHGANGDGLQLTSTGLMVWRKADNWTAFTDASRTWVNGPYGIAERSNDHRFPWEADDRIPVTQAQLSVPIPAPLPQVVSSEFDAATEKAALDMVNGSRAQFGVPPVVIDEAVRQVARARAKDMAVRNYFAHVNPDGKSPFDLVTAAGIRFGRAAENIGMGSGCKTAVGCVSANHNAMMAETPPNDGHRVNILNASLKKVGIGVYRAPDGRTYYACDFTD